MLHKNRDIWCVFLYDWYLPLSTMFSRFIHDVAWIHPSFFSRLENVLLRGFTIFCSYIHPQIDTWLVSIFGLWWTMQSQVLYGHMFSFLLGIHPGGDLLSHLVAQCLITWGTPRLDGVWTFPWGEMKRHLLPPIGHQKQSKKGFHPPSLANHWAYLV